MIRNFREVLEAVRALPPQVAAVVSPEEENTLLGVEEARNQGLIRPHLFGEVSRIEKLAGEAGISLEPYVLHPATSQEEAASEAVSLCREGGAEVLVKGFLPTPTFLRAVLSRERGIASGGLLSHVALFEVPKLGRILLITDGGIVVLPTLAQKLQILSHAVEVAHAMGNPNPKVALLASVETVSAEIPATTDAAIITTMWRRKQIRGCTVDGPLALDNALVPAALAEKGIDSPLQAEADILLVPNIESGNLLGKSIVHLAGGTMAGVVIGAKVPIALVSRIDPPQSKLYSVAVCALIAHASRDRR
jgi:phosphate butyryltransferase